MTEEHYKQYINTLNNTIKQLKQTYYTDLFTRFKNDTAKIWKIVNQLSKKSLKNKNIEHIVHNNKKITGTSDIAELFNNFFINIAIQLNQNLPPPTTNPRSYLSGNYPNSMAIPTIYPQDIIRIINSLKN